MNNKVAVRQWGKMYNTNFSQSQRFISFDIPSKIAKHFISCGRDYDIVSFEIDQFEQKGEMLFFCQLGDAFQEDYESRESIGISKIYEILSKIYKEQGI